MKKDKLSIGNRMKKKRKFKVGDRVVFNHSKLWNIGMIIDDKFGNLATVSKCLDKNHIEIIWDNLKSLNYTENWHVDFFDLVKNEKETNN